jgi:uncharacterized protein YndB with AHSA1/START domain
MDNDALGTIIRDGERRGLRFERRLAHPPEKVWRALTESDYLRHWFPADIVGQREAGATIQLPFWPDHIAKYGLDDPPLPGAIHVWDPPRVFEWSWDTDLLRFELRPVGGGTLLTFTTWLDDGSDQSLANAGAGYHVCLATMATYLDTGSAPRLVDLDVAPFERRYEAAVAGAGEP